MSLERLDALLETPAQRIGLSATVEPVDEVARYLAGGRPVEVVRPPSTKEWDLDVVVPIADMSALGEVVADDLSGPAAGAERRASIWPHVEERIVDLVAQHRSTLVFANSRRLAERLTGAPQRDLAGAASTTPSSRPTPTTEAPWRPRPRARGIPGSRTPAEIMAQSGASAGRPAVLARAHHGSVSKEHRQLIEEDLKAGRLPAVVATSSLELGIDMGAVDLVVQVESPPSVASGLQRVGRAGHQVGAVSRGVLFPKFRGDLVQTAVVVERMRAGAIESLRVPPTRSTCSPSRSSRCAPWTTGPSTTSSSWSGAPPRSPRCPARSSSRCSTCCPAATRATSSPSCAHGSSGTASPASSPVAAARSGWP